MNMATCLQPNGTKHIGDKCTLKPNTKFSGMKYTYSVILSCRGLVYEFKSLVVNLVSRNG